MGSCDDRTGARERYMKCSARPCDIYKPGSPVYKQEDPQSPRYSSEVGEFGEFIKLLSGYRSVLWLVSMSVVRLFAVQTSCLMVSALAMELQVVVSVGETEL